MRIALVSQEYPPETAKGGIGTQTHLKALGLAAKGHQVYVLTRATGQRKISQHGNIQIIRMQGFEDLLPEMTTCVQWITQSTLVAAELERISQHEGLDVIDFAEWGAEGYIYLLNRTAWKRTPVVLQLHGPLIMFAHTMNWPDRESDFYKTGIHMESTCVQLADAIYSSSACSASWIQKYYDPSRLEIPVIHLGVNTELFQPRHDDLGDSPKMVFAGRIVQNKGIEELIEAIGMIKKEISLWKVMIIGNGEMSYLNYLHQKIHKLGLSDIIEFRGYLQGYALAEAFRQAKLFVAPSYYEGGPGFVYLEAMACGLPVIACSGSGVEEIVKENFNGKLVPPKNTSALATALLDLTQDEAKRKILGKNAYSYIQKEAQYEHCLERLEAFYRNVIENEPFNEMASAKKWNLS